MTRMLRAIAVLVTLLPATRVLAQQACGSGAAYSTAPVRPRQGTLFLVHVTGVADNVALSGEVAGVPLHFAPDENGVLTSLAAAPIDSSGSLGVSIECVAGMHRDSLRGQVSLAPGQYPLERLRVAPRFSATPDSALRERTRREAALAAAVSAGSQDTPRLWSPPFAPPRPSRVTSPFGGGRQFNGTVTSRHMGTDFAGAVGAPIRATNRGVVRLVDNFFLGGNVVYVDHGEGLVTAYLHMSAHSVAAGDTVERGTILGKVGATGRVTGPHLHFIARYGGTTVDPQSLLAIDAATPAPTSATPGKKNRPLREE